MEKLAYPHSYDFAPLQWDLLLFEKDAKRHEMPTQLFFLAEEYTSLTDTCTLWFKGYTILSRKLNESGFKDIWFAMEQNPI